MTKQTLTWPIIHAAATDAGNRHMRAAGRTVWSEDDWNIAAREFDRLAKVAYGPHATARAIVEAKAEGREGE